MTNHYLHDSVIHNITNVHNFTGLGVKNLAQSAGDYVYIESHTSNIRLMYHNPSGTIFVPTSVPNVESTDFFFYNDGYYLVQKGTTKCQLIELSCSGAACAYSGVVADMLPYTYKYAEGAASAYLYAVGETHVLPI